MPRSSSGEFQAVLRPWVAVNAPPSGGPTSSPKMSVTPCRSSATCSAIRMAWTMLLTHKILLAEDVVEDRLRIRLWLLFHLAVRGGKLGVELRPQLVHLRAAEQAALLEAALESDQAVGLVEDLVGARRTGVPVQPREHGFQQEGLALGADVLHRGGDLAVADLGVVAVDGLRLDAEALAAVGDALLAMLSLPVGRDAPLVVGDDDQHRQRVGRPRRPDQAGGEIALGGAGIAA